MQDRTSSKDVFKLISYAWLRYFQFSELYNGITYIVLFFPMTMCRIFGMQDSTSSKDVFKLISYTWLRYFQLN